MQVSFFFFFFIFATPKELFLSGPKNELEMTKVHLGTGRPVGAGEDPGDARTEEVPAFGVSS